MQPLTETAELAESGLTFEELHYFRHYVWLLLQSSGNTNMLSYYQLADMKRMLQIAMYVQGVWSEKEIVDLAGHRENYAPRQPDDRHAALQAV